MFTTVHLTHCVFCKTCFLQIERKIPRSENVKASVVYFFEAQLCFAVAVLYSGSHLARPCSEHVPSMWPGALF